MESRTPDTIQAVIKNIIPPKRIRRKNIEGAELLILLRIIKFSTTFQPPILFRPPPPYY